MSNTQEFIIGQIFEGTYPPEAAVWCNNNNAIMVDLGNGNFQIQAIPELTLAEVKAQKINELTDNFTYVELHSYTMSSLGFNIDANTRSDRDVRGLINNMEAGILAEPTLFRAYNNTYHQVTLAELKTMLGEIITKGQLAYAQKWQTEQDIANATDVNALLSYDTRQHFTGVDWEYNTATALNL